MDTDRQIHTSVNLLSRQPSSWQAGPAQLEHCRCDGQLWGGGQREGGTPALLIQLQQVLPVTMCAQARQEQHLAEVLHGCFHNISLLSPVAANTKLLSD